jgi:Na+/melibiose symporter-like transporter
MIFNPPDFVVYDKDGNPDPYFPYFIILPSLMNIGQGAIQLAHMSIVNSMTYDQKRRDYLINYRNSCAYATGIFVPAISYYIFKNVVNNEDQFSLIANISMAFGLISAVSFMLIVNEPNLVKRSKYIYDKYFLIVEDEPDSDGKLLDTDDEFSENGSDSAPP